MKTGHLRFYGKKDTVQEYIDVAVKHLGLSKDGLPSPPKILY